MYGQVVVHVIPLHKPNLVLYVRCRKRRKKIRVMIIETKERGSSDSEDDDAIPGPPPGSPKLYHTAEFIQKFASQEFRQQSLSSQGRKTQKKRKLNVNVMSFFSSTFVHIIEIVVKYTHPVSSKKFIFSRLIITEKFVYKDDVCLCFRFNCSFGGFFSIFGSENLQISRTSKGIII